MDSTGVLREGAELFPSQDPESFPKRAKRNNQKPNQTLMTQTKVLKKAIAISGREIITNWFGFGKEGTILHFIFFSQQGTMDKDSESLTLVRVLILCTLLLVLGSHLLALSEVWNVENSSDIYQNLTRFYFIIINFTFSFSLASKWNNEAIYQKIPQRLISSGRNPLGDPPLKAEMEMFELMLKNLHRPFEDNFFSRVPVDYKWDINFWTRLLMMDCLEGVTEEALVLLWGAGLEAAVAARLIGRLWFWSCVFKLSLTFFNKFF